MFSVCISVLGAGRRGHRPRAVLRDVPRHLRHRRRDDGQRAAAPRAGVPARRRRCRGRAQRAHARDRPDDAEQPDRCLRPRRGARGARRDLPRAQPLADRRRGLRLAALRWPQARERARRGRRRGAHRGHLEPLEVARDDRLAHGLGGRAGGAEDAPRAAARLHAVRLAAVHLGRGDGGAARGGRRDGGDARRLREPCRRRRAHRRPGRPALPHADGRDVHHARRPRLRPVRHRVRRAAARDRGRLGAADRSLRPERRRPRAPRTRRRRGRPGRGLPSHRALRREPAGARRPHAVTS